MYRAHGLVNRGLGSPCDFLFFFFVIGPKNSTNTLKAQRSILMRKSKPKSSGLGQRALETNNFIRTCIKQTELVNRRAEMRRLRSERGREMKINQFFLFHSFNVRSPVLQLYAKEGFIYQPAHVLVTAPGGYLTFYLNRTILQ